MCRECIPTHRKEPVRYSGCGCGCGLRPFLTHEEEIEESEKHKKQLQKEIAGAEERITEPKG